MSFADPLTVTISGTPIALPRTSVGEDESEYTSGDGLVKVTASHSYGKRDRRLIRIDHSKLSADVFRPTENVKSAMSYYGVFDLPKAGYTAADALAVFSGFNALMTASSNALVTKLLGGES
jgi:hypothetical protein